MATSSQRRMGPYSQRSCGKQERPSHSHGLFQPDLWVPIVERSRTLFSTQQRRRGPAEKIGRADKSISSPGRGYSSTNEDSKKKQMQFTRRLWRHCSPLPPARLYSFPHSQISDVNPGASRRTSRVHDPARLDRYYRMAFRICDTAAGR